MADEIVAVAVDGTLFSAWTRAQVRASVKEAARSFRLEVAAEAGAEMTALAFQSGTEIKLYSNGSLIVTGFVDKFEPAIDEREAKVFVSGRATAADIIDSNPEHETGYFKDKSLAEIAKELDKQGVGITVEGDDDKGEYQITPGETTFRALERLARSKEMVATGQADGSVKFWVPGKSSKRHAGGIFEGVNMKRGAASHDWSGRGSKYIVRGQAKDGHGADALEIEAIARDNTVKRNRPVIIVVEEATTKDKAKKLAERARDRAAGFSLTARITMQGFRDDAGKNWEPGLLVWVESPFLNLAQDMLIESADFVIDEQGSSTLLDLVDPRSYGAKKKGKGNKSGKTKKKGKTSGSSDEGTGLWDQDSDPAEVTP